jgi:hypothetical protein
MSLISGEVYDDNPSQCMKDSVRQRVLRLLDSVPTLRHREEKRMSVRKGRAFLFVLTIFVLSVAAPELYAADKTSLEPSRDSIIHIVEIQNRGGSLIG